jgi:hypothetical protein
MSTAAALSAFITASAGYFIVSFIADDTASNSANIYDNDAIFADNGAFMGAFIKNGNAQAYNWDGSADTPTADAISTGTAYVYEWWHSGGNLNSRLNGGTTRTVASGNTTTLVGPMLIGRNYTASYADINIFELAAASTVPGSTDMDAIAASFKTWCGA